MLGTKTPSRLPSFYAHTQYGFSLIEIAIVLVVIGLIISGGLLAVSPVIESAKSSETKQKIATVEAAILGYVIANGCLPCPAARAIGGTPTGLSNDNADQALATPCATDGTCINNAGNGAAGIVPWVTLGISQNDATDAWGRLLTFAVDGSLTNATTDVARTTTGALPTFTTSTITINNTTAGAPASLGYNSVAYVLVSHGSDGVFGETRSFTTTADIHGTPANEGQRENGDDDLTFAFGQFNGIEGGAYYDDIVSFKSLHPLILSCGAGACGNPS